MANVVVVNATDVPPLKIPYEIVLSCNHIIPTGIYTVTDS